MIKAFQKNKVYCMDCFVGLKELNLFYKKNYEK